MVMVGERVHDSTYQWRTYMISMNEIDTVVPWSVLDTNNSKQKIEVSL
jgi:hypothetical protein